MEFDIEAEQTGPMQVKVDTGSFELVIDEKEEMMGDDEGPNPIEYQLAALSGCLNVVGTFIAKQQGLDIEKKEFNVSGEIDPEGFRDGSSGVKPGLKEVNVDVAVETTEDQETVENWLEEVEQRCPVSDSLRSQTEVNVRLD